MVAGGRPLIGVLALQGCVERHRPHIEAAGGRFAAIRRAADLEAVDAIILPGGESSTMLKLIDRFDLRDVLHRELSRKPVWGICAGAILLAERVVNPEQESFSLIPMVVRRNAYGRQLASTVIEIDGFAVSFIRAPVIEGADEDVEILSRRNADPVWVRYRHAMASTFHPELTLRFPSPMHLRFLTMCGA
jgi:5'-phosphate synthase pdxT subunit